MFFILCHSAFWHVFTLSEESMEVAQNVDKLSDKKKCAIKWRKHDSIRCDFRFKAWALVTAYEQQDSCGVYHAVQCNNLCHMLTWAWRGKKISMLIQRVRSVRLCCVSEAGVTVICPPPPTHERNQVILPFMHSVLLKCRNSLFWQKLEGNTYILSFSGNLS